MSSVGMYRATCHHCASRLTVSRPEVPAPRFALLPRATPRYFNGPCPSCGRGVRFDLAAVANREEAGKWRT